jgi:hypothetical protein
MKFGHYTSIKLEKLSIQRVPRLKETTGQSIRAKI